MTHPDGSPDISNCTVSVLETSLYHPHVVYGGGCMETMLGAHLQEKVGDVIPDP